MTKIPQKEYERDMMEILGSIAAGEPDAILIILERSTKAGEIEVVTRYGGMDENGARKLAANALWSNALSQEELKKAQGGTV